MRIERIKSILTSFALGTVLVLAPACSDSNNMTGPVAASAASVAGTWTGNFRADAASCTSAPVTVTFQQTGNNVTGTFRSSSCGPNAAFNGHVEGTRLTGAVEMLGCSGGAVTGQISGSGLSLQLGDLYRPIVTGDQVVAPGGSATLSR